MTYNLPYREDLQVMRGVSILLVVFYHLNITGFQNGFLGVDIFFVLSGFLMAGLADKTSPLDFYTRRVKRLLPSYFVVILFTTLTVTLVAVPTDTNQTLDRIFFDLAGLSNLAFWAENSYFSSSAFKPLLNLWSLSVELQFYLIAPFLLPYLRNKRILLIIIIFTSLLLSMLLLMLTSPKTSFFMLPTRLWEFLLGAYAAWFPPKYEHRNTNLIIKISITALLLTILFYPIQYQSNFILEAHPGFAAYAVAILSAIIFSIGINSADFLRYKLFNLIKYLGDYSYSIYLTHFPVIVLINYKAFGGTRLGYNSIEHLIAILILTFILSFILHNYVEKLKHSKNFSLSIAALVIACVGLGTFGSRLNERFFSEDEIVIYNAGEDRTIYRCGITFRVLNTLSNVCTLGDSFENDSVLLLGNSHADSIKVAFNQAMAESEITTYFYVHNNPLMSSSQNEDIIQTEVQKNNISSIVIHYSASFYNESGNLSRLKAFMSLMEEINVSVLIIAPVPVYDQHIPRMMLELLRDPTNVYALTDSDDYDAQTENFNVFIIENKIPPENIWYPHTYFCSNNQCAYQQDGTPYYFDSEHLTLTGASYLHPLFREISSRLSSADNP